MKLSAAKFNELIEDAIVDAYGESEQRVAFYTVIEENLALPFVIRILGVDVTVERIELTKSEEIVAICRRGRSRQAIPILELPLPKRAPSGAEWIEAYRCWSRGN